MSERPRQSIHMADLTEEAKLMLALELLEEPANLSVKDNVFRTLMEEADSLGQDGWLNHILGFLSVGTYVHLVLR